MLTIEHMRRRHESPDRSIAIETHGNKVISFEVDIWRTYTQHPINFLDVVIEHLQDLREEWLAADYYPDYEKRDMTIKDIVNRRTEAKNNKDWELADKLKQEAIDLGFMLNDHANGFTSWRDKKY